MNVTATKRRVLIVANDPLARAGLDALLSGERDLVVSGSVSPDVLPSVLKLYRPDVVLWDCAWSSDPLSEALLELASGGESAPEAGSPAVVALVMDAPQARTLWQAGIRSILLRSVRLEALTAGLEATLAGLWALSPELVAGIPVLRTESSAAEMEALTDREVEVLRLIAEGLANRAIAHRLEISEHTVKFHVNSILDKLQVQSRTEAVVKATRAGLILL